MAESKFRQETEKMVNLIKKEDRKGIDEAITNAKVEQKVLARLRLKARTYGTDPSIGADAEEKINVDAVVAMYEVGEDLSPFCRMSMSMKPPSMSFVTKRSELRSRQAGSNHTCDVQGRRFLTCSRADQC